MQPIKSLIQELNTKDQEKIFNAFKIMDSNIQELLNRIKGLELRNLKFYCRAGRLVDQTIVNGGAYVLLTTTDHPQFGNMHDNTNDSDKIFIRRSGVYDVAGCIQFPATAGGTFRSVRIDVTRNGAIASITSHRDHPIAPVIQVLNCSTTRYLYVGDVLQLFCGHDVPAGLDITGNFPQAPTLTATERAEDLYPEDYGLLNPEANTR